MVTGWAIDPVLSAPRANLWILDLAGIKFRSRLRSWANRSEEHWYEIDLDGTFEEGQCLWGKVDLVYVQDVIFQETAFLIREEGGVLIVGDLLAGGRADQGIQDEGFALGGPLYVSDLRKARESLRKLLLLDFKTLCFAHGTPVRERPAEKLRSFLDSDSVWKLLEQAKASRDLTDEEKAEIALLRELNGGMTFPRNASH